MSKISVSIDGNEILPEMVFISDEKISPPSILQPESSHSKLVKIFVRNEATNYRMKCYIFVISSQRCLKSENYTRACTNELHNVNIEEFKLSSGFFLLQKVCHLRMTD